MTSPQKEPTIHPHLYRQSRQFSNIYYLPNGASQVENAKVNAGVFVIQPGNGNSIASSPSRSSTYHDVTPQKFNDEDPSGSIQKLVQTIPETLRTPESRGVFFVKQIAISLLGSRNQTDLQQKDISGIVHDTLSALAIAIKEKHCDESLSVDEQRDALAFAASLTKATPEKVVKTLDSHLDDVAGITISNIHAAATQVREAAGNAQIAIEAPRFVPMQIDPAKTGEGFTVQVLDSDRTLTYVANAVDMDLAPKPVESKPESLLKRIEESPLQNEHFEHLQNDTAGNGNVAEITIEVGGREIPLHLALDIQGKLPKDKVQPFLQRVADNIAQHASKPGTVDAFVQTLVQQITIVGGDLNLTCNNLAYYAHDIRSNRDFYDSLGNARVLLVDTKNPRKSRLANNSNTLGVKSKPHIAVVLGTNNALNPSNFPEIITRVQQGRLENFLNSQRWRHGALRFIPSEENSNIRRNATRLMSRIQGALEVNSESRDTKIVAFLKEMANHIENLKVPALYNRHPALNILGSLVEIVKKLDKHENILLEIIENLNIEKIQMARDTIVQVFRDNPPEILMSDFDNLLKFLEKKQKKLSPRQSMTPDEEDQMSATQPTPRQSLKDIQDDEESRILLLAQVKEVRSHAKHEGKTAHTFSFEYAGGTLHIAMTSPTLQKVELEEMWLELGEQYEFAENYSPEQRIEELIMSFDQGLRMTQPSTTAVVSVAYVVDNKTVLATYGGEKQRTYLLMADGTLREESKYPPALGTSDVTISPPRVITHENSIGMIMIASDHPIPSDRLGEFGFKNGLVDGELMTLIRMAIKKENKLNMDADVAYQYVALGKEAEKQKGPGQQFAKSYGISSMNTTVSTQDGWQGL